MAKQTKAGQSKKTLKLIVSDEKQPAVDLKPGMRLDVVSITLLDPQFKKARAGGARLCGGTNTCLALHEIRE